MHGTILHIITQPHILNQKNHKNINFYYNNKSATHINIVTPFSKIKICTKSMYKYK